MSASITHAPGVMPSKWKAPLSSVSVTKLRSPCVARTVAPGTDWPPAFTVPDWANAVASKTNGRLTARSTRILNTRTESSRSAMGLPVEIYPGLFLLEGDGATTGVKHQFAALQRAFELLRVGSPTEVSGNLEHHVRAVNLAL